MDPITPHTITLHSHEDTSIMSLYTEPGFIREHHPSESVILIQSTCKNVVPTPGNKWTNDPVSGNGWSMKTKRKGRHISMTAKPVFQPSAASRRNEERKGFLQ
ncbi:hypothetical protein TNCV_2142541 [Trichonephila clavipes]|nr:hypothetical protein TNCV_2142541 [Trichonephila clavipes]